MIKQLKYTISEVSKILVPLDQTYFPRLRLGKAEGNRSGQGEPESCQLPQWYTLTVYYIVQALNLQLAL